MRRVEVPFLRTPVLITTAVHVTRSVPSAREFYEPKDGK